MPPRRRSMAIEAAAPEEPNNGALVIQQRNDKRLDALQATIIQLQAQLQQALPIAAPVAINTLTYNENTELDNKFPAFEAGRGSIKVIWKMPSFPLPTTMQVFDDWESKLDLLYEANLNAYTESRTRIATAVGTFVFELRTAYNRAKKAYPAITRHWRKFIKWVQQTALRGSSAYIKAATEL